MMCRAMLSLLYHVVLCHAMLLWSDSREDRSLEPLSRAAAADLGAASAAVRPESRPAGELATIIPTNKLQCCVYISYMCTYLYDNK